MMDNTFFIIIITLIIYKTISYSYNNKFISAFFNIFGTTLHEISHLLISIILNGKPVSFSVMPYKEEDKLSVFTKFINWIKLKIFGIKTIYNQDLVLGGVGHTNLQWYNSFFIGLAPLLLIPLAYYLNIYLLNTIEPTLLNKFLTLFLTITIIVNSIPSKSDIDIAFKYKTISILIFGLLFYIIYYYRRYFI